MKQCRKCGEMKATTEFAKRTASPDGLQTNCKVCNRETNQKFRKTRPDYKQQWDKLNPGAQSKLVAAWAKRNPEKHSNNVHKYYSKLGSGVYRVNNLVTRESYIGSSKYLVQRMNQHFNANFNGASNKNLQNSMREFGIQWFSFEILESCPVNKLLEREQYWVDLLDPEFNKANPIKKDVN